ncbi:hypothetical protein P175DRAFT_0530389 [Aspergillus ochraceoroseus IBT 24754]|uniref:Uncharacterized protein n=1 Tax=Aspergillus ochraceoroseus IBT 24754 TaxID=1392256 RepID=A0A2T5M420_9EURO|nr:uncharacterized protein P175DRAFT_0530389 [Aspergillus ochraceoroseus IBT 24754]PTU23283.1 hypothetical protein P175DRAFT_0530389 [Aspergillus ochraceoroseus IBT 24754]
MKAKQVGKAISFELLSSTLGTESTAQDQELCELCTQPGICKPRTNQTELRERFDERKETKRHLAVESQAEEPEPKFLLANGEDE